MFIGKNRVIERSNLTSRFDNHDYDGDSIIAASMHSEQARYDFKYAFVRNLVEFEHLDELLIDYEHESIYSAFMLTHNIDPNAVQTTEVETIETLSDLERSVLLLETQPTKKYLIKEFKTTLTYVEWLINYGLYVSIQDPILKYGSDLKIEIPIYSIQMDGELNKKNLNKLTNKINKIINNINTELNYELLNFWDVIHEFDKFLLECSGAVTYCSPTFKLQDFVVNDAEIDSFKENLFSEEPYIAFHQNMVLFEKVKNEVEKNPDNILNLVFKSGARLKSVQLLKAASNTGIPTDIYGKAFSANIKNSLLDGLSQREYFMTGDSARLALAQRQEAIPKGGELQRKFFFTIGILKLDKDVEDCQADLNPDDWSAYPILIKNKSHLKLLNHRFFIDTDSNGNKIKRKIDFDTATREDLNYYDSLIGQTVDFFSPVTCKCDSYKICKTCFGDKIPDSVNLGALTGAALSEGIIQSVLRTHHFGGAFIATENKTLLSILRKAKFNSNTIILYEDAEESVAFIKEYLYEIYDETHIEFNESYEIDGSLHLEIKVNELPFNDDSVKQLNNIVGLIDKNRDTASLIDPSELYDGLEMVIEQNGILSSYLELIISLLYYDEDGILLRYTDKPPVTQVALKNIIEMLDPKLSIFYNFSNRVISKIYTKKGSAKVDHMYHDLLGIYR